MFRSLKGFGVAAIALVASIGAANATPYVEFSLSTDGVTWVDQNSQTSPDAFGAYTLNGSAYNLGTSGDAYGINSISVSGSAPGGPTPQALTTTSISLSNSSSGTKTFYIRASYVGVAGFPYPVNYSTSGAITSVTGPGGTVEFMSFVSPTNTDYGKNTALADFSLSTLGSNSAINTGVVTGTPFSESEYIKLTLASGTTVGLSEQINVVPEPATLSLLGASLAGIAFLRRRAKR